MNETFIKVKDSDNKEDFIDIVSKPTSDLNVPNELRAYFNSLKELKLRSTGEIMSSVERGKYVGTTSGKTFISDEYKITKRK